MRLLLSMVIIYFSVVSTLDASWAYSFVVYNGNIYVITQEEVEEDQLKRKIGQVTSYTDREGTYRGNFSNTFPKGTQYYEINGVDVSEAIAVKTEKAVYIKAYYEGEYAGKDVLASVFSNNKASPWVLLSATVLIALILTSYKKRKKRKNL
ncbi:hypothetical protein [Paenibacillus sp. J2TS4]|uniref:hypothetical protein n=1 Tax=Paenibacillus sp. J2TS4 TaxID=2807194 RepID=UPI001BCE70DA|nr:hypothetical protein [Paenibacillus sp. J2TS4]